MIVMLSPRFKFVCERCGKEIFSDNEGRIPMQHQVSFRAHTDYRSHTDRTGEVCDECLKEFLEYAENFFDETNKEKGGVDE